MKKMLLLLCIIPLIIMGCSVEVEENKETIVKIEKIEEIKEIEEKSEKDVIPEEKTIEIKEVEEVKEIDLDEIRPNEMGKVMVIMYHSFGESEKQFVSTPEIFKEDLIELNDLGYVLVSLEDYVNNNMDIEAGKTPVILTFDDGHSTNFKVFEENGEIKIDPKSAVGIIESVYKENVDFGREATFFLNGNIVFGQAEYVDYKLNYLIDNGYDIGNHSNGHEDLSTLSADAIQNTLAINKEKIESHLNGYEVRTLALPFGKRPKDEKLEEFIYNGKWSDIGYNNIAVLNVGWNPANSPISKKFNYKSINRVQAGSMEFQLDHWIDYFEKNPNNRYISDGNINEITVPESLKEYIDYDKIGSKELIFYERK
ncbi:polysaccharide deacetylase family protein [Clostridiaceae bacterium HSG29]|nr:polysaccharide deacetylase family protein [Clostridiaceae bacterium HSG29]